MNRQRSQNRASILSPIVRILIVVGVFSSLFVPGIAAQQLPPRYRVGDRVEIDTIQQTDPTRGIWKKATAVEVNVANQIYFFAVDAPVGKIPQVFGIGIRSPQLYIRAVHGVDSGPQTLTKKRHEAPNGTVLADRATVSCDTRQRTSKNGSTPSPELMKRLIQCLWEKPSEVSGEGAQTVDILTFQGETRRKWAPFQDIGNGRVGTYVYPFKATWTLKNFYRTRATVQTDESVFACFVNTASQEWECGLAETLKEGSVKEFQIR